MSRESEYRVYSGKELIETPTEEERYLIEGLLWEGDHAFILGREKSGKSILALQMACALTSGSSFLSTYEVPEAVDVLYVQAEGKRRDTIERIKAMSNDEGVEWNPDKFHLLYYHSIGLDTPNGFNEFQQLIRKAPKPQVIFLDPLYMSMLGDLTDNTAARNMVRNLRKIGELYNCSIITVHHENRPRRDTAGKIMDRDKSESIFGSFVWSAFADHIIAIDRRKDGVYLLSCETQRTARVVDRVEMRMIQPYPLYYEIIGADQKPYVEKVFDFIVKANNNGLARKDIEKLTTLSISAVEKSLRILVREGKIKRLNPGRRPVKYGCCEDHSA